LSRIGGRPAAFAPVFRGSEVVGILNASGARLKANDLVAVAILGYHVGIALENAELQEELTVAREMVASNERRLSTLFEAVGAGIIGVDRQCRITFANQAAEDLLQRERSDLIRAHFNAILHPGRACAAAAVDAESCCGESECDLSRACGDWQLDGDLEEEFTRADGTIRQVALTMRAFGNDEQGGALIIRDISDAVDMRRRLVKAQRMESLGRLAGGVAHEFNNLLTVILGLSEEVRYSDRLTQQDAEDLDEIMTAARRAATLTGQLLAYGRRQRQTVSVVELERFVGQIADLFDTAASEGVEVHYEPSTTPLPVAVDPTQLRQVLTHIMSNANDAMPEGGQLKLKTEAASADGNGEEVAVLTIEDTGVGMDEDTQSHLFEPFFTTKGVGRGVGLGLATCHGIIGQSGGSIEVSSAPGDGSTFRIQLPLATALEGEEAS